MRFPRQEYWNGVTISFSRGFSQPKVWIYIFCSGRRILYHWLPRTPIHRVWKIHLISRTNFFYKMKGYSRWSIIIFHNVIWNIKLIQAWAWCTGMTQRDGMRREVGGVFRIENTCTSMVASCWYMAKPIQYCKEKKWQIHVDIWQNQYNIVK